MYRGPMLKFAPALIVTLLATPALANATPWLEIAPGVKARMITSDAVAMGKTTLGLEVDLPEGYVTYWRVPGESGIPTTIDMSGSTGLTDPVIEWPYPQIDEKTGMRDFVYRGHLVLPIVAKADGSSGTLNAAIIMGVCSDICVPARATFTLPLSFGAQDPEQSLRLQMAEVQLPAEWDQPQEPFGAITATPNGLAISGIDDTIDPASVIADVGDPALIFAAPQKSPDGTSWSMKLLGGAGGEGLAGRTVQLTFTTRLGPYAVTRPIGAVGNK